MRNQAATALPLLSTPATGESSACVSCAIKPGLLQLPPSLYDHEMSVDCKTGRLGSCCSQINSLPLPTPSKYGDAPENRLETIVVSSTDIGTFELRWIAL